MKYDSVIFDLDGTLLDTLEDLWASVNFALNAFGMPERSIEEVRAFVGNGIGNLIKRAVPEGCSDCLCGEVLDAFKSHYKDHSRDMTRPYEGIIPLLERLKAEGVKTAIVSNKADFAVQALVPVYFDGLIDVAVGELSGVPRKPEPDTVHLAMEKLSAKRAVYVGDSEVDVKTAKNAGLDGIFVTWGFRSEDVLRGEGAQVIVNTAEELWEVLS